MPEPDAHRRHTRLPLDPRQDGCVCATSYPVAETQSPCRYNAALLNRLVFENLRYRPVRTILGVLAIGIEVTMILTLVGISYGTLDETARRARGVGADIVVQPPVTFVISLSSSPMRQDLLSRPQR